jgi:hypothetical protein
MPSFLRVFCCRGISLCLAAALILGGCSSSASPTAPSTPAPPTLDILSIGVKVFNDTPYCAWITPYWAYPTWANAHIFDPGRTGPRFVDAGESYNFAYLVLAKNPLATNVQIKVMAEPQVGPGCKGGNWPGQSPYRTSDLAPVEGILEACAHLVYAKDKNVFVVTEPRRTGPDPSADHCPM